MTLALVTAPAALAVDETAVWAHLRLVTSGGSPDEPEDAAYVRDLIAAAIGELDGRDGLLGRALIAQTWRLKLPCFPRVIELPLPPLQSVASIAYLDTTGASQTLDASAYVVSGIGGAWQAEVCPAAGTSWPATARHPEAVTIEFTAGYGDAPENVPAPIRAAIMETVATRYALREGAAYGTGTFTALPDSAAEALDAFRVWAF